jgi:hypothetical protein
VHCPVATFLSLPIRTSPFFLLTTTYSTNYILLISFPVRMGKASASIASSKGICGRGDSVRETSTHLESPRLSRVSGTLSTSNTATSGPKIFRDYRGLFPPWRHRAS